jgi:hypothetical protein
MEPLPSYVAEWINELAWPDKDDNGNTTLSERDLGLINAILTALVNYIEQQLTACRKPDA